MRDDKKGKLEEDLFRLGLENSLKESSVRRGYNPVNIVLVPIMYIIGKVSKIFRPYGYTKY